MAIHLLTLDFRHAPIALREKVAFPEYKLPEALRALQEVGASEAAILSTCNRVELMARFPSSLDGPRTLVTFLSQWHGIPASDLAHHFRHLTGEDAARHLIRVACGLESLVPGEMQILGQVKGAARVAREAETLGKQLGHLFDQALKAGRRARNETHIARRPVSISHVAVTLIQQHFGNDLSGRRVLLIGSGKMGEVAAQQLHKAGAAHVIVANRTLERACQLAQRWNGSALPFDEVPQTLSQVDAVICATSAPHPILYQHHIVSAIEKRAALNSPSSPLELGGTEGGRRPSLLLIDLAVPRDIEPTVGEIAGVTLCDVDGLQAVVADNIALRNEEREQVEQIVAQILKKWHAQEAARTVAPTITTLRRSIEEIRQSELEKALGRLSHLSEKERSVIETLSWRLMNKFLHTPTVRLRQMAATNDGPRFQETVEELFALKGELA